MPPSPALKRLLRVRQLLEEQSQATLKAANGYLSDLNTAAERAHARQTRGQNLFKSGAQAADATDRVAGLCEAELARTRKEALMEDVQQAQISVQRQLAELQTAYQERRKSELLINAVVRKTEAETRRQLQRELDDLHRSRPRDAF